MGVARLERRDFLSGELENADSVTLSNQAATAAITRDDSGAIVVLAGLATTNPSVGVYEYDWTALGLDPGLTYAVHWKVQKAGLPTEYPTTKIGPLDSGRGLRSYRRALFEAGELGPWSLHTTTAASGAANELIAATLADVDKEPTAYQGVHVYLVDGALAGQQRRVRGANTKNPGFVPAEGRLYLHRPFGGSPAQGVSFELLHRLPAIRTEDGRPGVRECINRALETLPQVIRWELSAVSGQHRYALGGQPWLTAEVQVGRVFAPATAGGLNPDESFGGARLRLDAEQPHLELAAPFASGQTFQVELLIPGRRWIKSGGVWGQSNGGLQADDDEALVEPGLLRQAALAQCFKALAEHHAPNEADYWLKRAEAQERKAAAIRRYDQPRLPAPRRSRPTRITHHASRITPTRYRP